MPPTRPTPTPTGPATCTRPRSATSTERPTAVAVTKVGGRHVVRTVLGLLRPQVLRSDGSGCRVALLATGATLIGGDTVRLDVSVGPGATLDLLDVAGTVAYHGRGAACGWHVRVTVAEGATLRYAGEPLVVASGADVSRSLTLDAAPDASLVVRDTVVLGRTGEVGGRLRTRTTIRVAGSLVLLEDQDLDPDGVRTLPGMLGPHRVVDSVTRLRDEVLPPAGVTSYALLGGVGTVVRWLGPDLASSPLHPGTVRRPSPRPGFPAGVG